MTNQTITRLELEQRLKAHPRPVLLEALPERYFHEGHLPGALNLPHTQVRERAPSLLPDQAAELIVYCASDTCQNSHLAASVLTSLGYRSVRVFAGGKKEWQEAGLPLETAATAAA